MGVKIVKILDLIRISRCYIITSNNMGIGTINVTFSCEALSYHEGVVLPAAIISTDLGCLMARENDITVSLTKLDIHKLLAADMKIPIKLLDVQKYESGEEHVVSSGKVFTCNNRHDIEYYTINNTLSANECDSLNDLVQQVENITINKSHFLYPLYNSFSTKKHPTHKVNIKDFIVPDKALPQGIWYRELELSRDELSCSNRPLMEDDKPVIESAFMVLSTFLFDILNFKRAFAAMEKEYLKEEDHEQLCLILRNAQSN